MSDKDIRDEEYMQDAIAAGKAAGTLHEVNPQDAPAPVRHDLASAQPRHAVPDSLADAALTAEDKAFGELTARIGAVEDEAPTVARHPSGAIDDFMDNPYAGELFRKLGPGKMDVLTAALREGQDLETRDNGVQRVMAIRAIQSAVHDLAENREAIPFDDSTGLGVAKEVSSILFSDPNVARRVNEALDRQDVLERESPGTHTTQVRAREAGITQEPSEGREV